MQNSWPLLAAFVAAVLAWLEQPHVPARDPAFFAYVGELLDRGFPLYQTVWDDKLPSIYLVNAALAAISPAYLGRWAIEAAVNGAAVVAFAELLRLERLPRLWPTIAFAAAIDLGPLIFGYTEFYAVAFTLAGFVALRRERAILGGVLVALAATFWLPAALAIVPALAGAAPPVRRRLAATWAATLALYLAAFVVWNPSEALGVIGSWTAYAGAHDAFGEGGRFAQLRDRFIEGAFEGGWILAALALLAVVRRPVTAAQRFGLWWTAASLAGAVTSLNLFAHYFLPSLPALIFATTAFAGRLPDRRPLRRGGQALLGLALLLALRTVWVVHTAAASELGAEARFERDLGRALGSTLGRERRILVENAYAPELYRAAQALPAVRYDVIAPVNRGYIARLPAYRAPDVPMRTAATAFVIERETPPAPRTVPGLITAGGYREVCRRNGWAVFARRPVSRAACGTAARDDP